MTIDRSAISLALNDWINEEDDQQTKTEVAFKQEKKEMSQLPWISKRPVTNISFSCWWFGCKQKQ